MVKYDLGIVDIRSIIQTLHDVHGYDFKNYALTFFKRRLEKIMASQNIKDVEDFIYRLKSGKDTLGAFLNEICVDTTEMFREPSTWRALKEEVIPGISNGAGTIKIWFPEVSSGEELFSTAIIFHKLRLLENVQFIASSISEQKIEKVKKGIFDPKKIEFNDANFVRIFTESNLADFYSVKNDKAYWDTSLIENTQFIKQNIIFDDYPKGVKLVMFRNQMIYLNQLLQERYIKIIHNSLVPGGILAIGNKEKVEYWNSDKDFLLINKTESFYKKKLSQ